MARALYLTLRLEQPLLLSRLRCLRQQPELVPLLQRQRELLLLQPEWYAGHSFRAAKCLQRYRW